MAARNQTELSALARAGFAAPSQARDHVDQLSSLLGESSSAIIDELAEAADPDACLVHLIELEHTHRGSVREEWAAGPARTSLIRLLGASSGLAEFFLRHPQHLDVLAGAESLPGLTEMTQDFSDALGIHNGVADSGGEDAVCLLRERYRRILVAITLHDVNSPDPQAVIQDVSRALSDAAAAALDAALAVARASLLKPSIGRRLFAPDAVENTRLAIIGMGKLGGYELNYVSDVDVIYVAAPDADLDAGRSVDIATRLAASVQRVLDEPQVEPALWEVDPNLRPEGKDGPLVRTLESHLSYYRRWAKSWEFQALLKARPVAGDLELGEEYTEAIAPMVWDSASREHFVESVQSMRERVTANIPADELPNQIKLGPGGLRDVEFTVQLLQLVHGQTDESIRARGTLVALAQLSDAGYIGRSEATDFATAYRFLRVLEHRLQLSRLRRTHLMPRDDDAALRRLARSSRCASNGAGLLAAWERTKRDVRVLHERIFYRPLLTAVAALPDDEMALSTDQARARLFAIGFRDPRGALSHMAALTAGVSRRATIQRHLLPVMIRWFAEGADPDYGLLAFRRLSDALGSTHWFLRMLRDSSIAAERLTRVLSHSRFVGELMAAFPESTAWLEHDERLTPLSARALREEMRAIFSRHESLDTAVKSVLRVRRREILRLAIGAVLDIDTVISLGQALTDITEATLEGVLAHIRASLEDRDAIRFAIIGMGRFGGAEIGFGSDTDVLYVYRPLTDDSEAAKRLAQRYASELARLTDDPVLPLDLDLGLRPEGKNGPVVRSLDSYRAYYSRWSLTWEAQALLRARGVAGDADLIADFTEVADTVRYPEDIGEGEIREIKRIKARVETERLPRGADPLRHVKLGRGSISDVEWYVQLVQLQHARQMAQLRTTSTLEALNTATDAGLIPKRDAAQLEDAWLLASRVRSAMTLWLNRTTDVLPDDRRQLEGIARILGYPPGSAGALEQDYFAVTRRARKAFEDSFFGRPDQPQTRAF